MIAGDGLATIVHPHLTGPDVAVNLRHSSAHKRQSCRWLTQVRAVPVGAGPTPTQRPAAAGTIPESRLEPPRSDRCRSVTGTFGNDNLGRFRRALDLAD